MGSFRRRSRVPFRLDSGRTGRPALVVGAMALGRPDWAEGGRMWGYLGPGRSPGDGREAQEQDKSAGRKEGRVEVVAVVYWNSSDLPWRF